MRRKVLLYIMVILFTLPYLITHVWMFVKNWPWPLIFPDSFGIRGFEYFFAPSSRSIQILGYSVFISGTVTLLTFLVCLPAARALSLYEFRGKSVIRGLIMLPVIIPILTVAMGIHMTFIRLGLANTAVGVILIHMIPGIPYGVRILQSIFDIHGDKLEKQARSLGSGRLQTFFKVTFPLILPGMVSAGSMIYIISFSQYLITFLIGGGNVVTFSLQMFPFIESGDRTVAATYSFIFVISILLVLSISEKIVQSYYKKTGSSVA